MIIETFRQYLQNASGFINGSSPQQEIPARDYVLSTHPAIPHLTKPSLFPSEIVDEALRTGDQWNLFK